MNASTKVGRGVPLARCAAARVDRGGATRSRTKTPQRWQAFTGRDIGVRPNCRERGCSLARGRPQLTAGERATRQAFTGAKSTSSPNCRAREREWEHVPWLSRQDNPGIFFVCTPPLICRTTARSGPSGSSTFSTLSARGSYCFWQAFTGRDIGVWPNCLASERRQAFTRAKSTSFPTAALLPGREVAKHRPWLSSPKNQAFSCPHPPHI